MIVLFHMALCEISIKHIYFQSYCVVSDIVYISNMFNCNKEYSNWLHTCYLVELTASLQEAVLIVCVRLDNFLNFDSM